MSYQYNTATSFSDETYLESFVEAVSFSLPSELQRSLQHLQMLDEESSKMIKHWRDSQDSCLRGVEAALLGAYRGDDAIPIEIPPATPVMIDATTTDGTNSSAITKKSPTSSERKKACYKCRNKKVRCDGQQPFCLFKEEYNNSGTGFNEADAICNSSEYYSPPQKKCKLSHNHMDADEEQVNTIKQSSSAAALPRLDTTRPPNAAEIRNVLLSRNPQYFRQRENITDVYHELQQCTREKIHTAYQLKSMIDMALGRLSRDIKKFESDLGLPQSSSLMSTATAGGRGPDPQPVMGVDAPAVSASVAINDIATASRTHGIDPSSNANKELAAVQTTPNSPDWILASIISHDKYTNMYTLSDEDVASNEVYTIPSRQVRPLKGMESVEWRKGDDIYAVYPDTTSFYPATVNNFAQDGFVMVHFKEDWDAYGMIHEMAIPVQHVMRAP